MTPTKPPTTHSNNEYARALQTASKRGTIPTDRVATTRTSGANHPLVAKEFAAKAKTEAARTDALNALCDGMENDARTNEIDALCATFLDAAAADIAAGHKLGEALDTIKERRQQDYEVRIAEGMARAFDGFSTIREALSDVAEAKALLGRTKDGNPITKFAALPKTTYTRLPGGKALDEAETALRNIDLPDRILVTSANLAKRQRGESGAVDIYGENIDTVPANRLYVSHGYRIVGQSDGNA